MSWLLLPGLGLPGWVLSGMLSAADCIPRKVLVATASAEALLRALPQAPQTAAALAGLTGVLLLPATWKSAQMWLWAAPKEP